MAESQTGMSDLVSLIVYPVSVFSAIGIGFGLTGVVLSALGGGNQFLSGSLFLVVIAIAVLTGPVIAGFVGLQLGEREQTETVYLASFLGNAIGYLVMVLIVFTLIAVWGAILSSGGTGTTGGTTGQSGSSARLLVPLFIIMVPTGITGFLTAYFHHRTSYFFGDSSTTTSQTTSASTATSQIISNLPSLRQFTAGILGTLLLLGGVYFIFIGAPASNLEVDGVGELNGPSLYADATIENVAEKEVTATVKARLKINGQTKDDFTASTKVTVGGGESTSVALRLGKFKTLSSSEKTAIQNENFVIQFLINGKVKDTSSNILNLLPAG